MEMEHYLNLLLKTYDAKHKESTAQGYKSCLRLVCREIDAHFNFSKLKHSNILELIVMWQEDGFANSTINNRLTHLRALCKLGYQDGLWAKNPCEGIKVLARDELVEKKIFSKDEIQTLEHTSTRQPCAKRMMLFGYNTGIRIEEAVVLAWEDVDWENGTISIQRSRALYECNTPKTRHSNRIIHLTKEALALLNEQFSVTRDGPKHTIIMKDKSAKSAKNVEIVPIFIDDLTGNMFNNSKDFAQRFFTKFLVDAGVEHRGPSLLRHTFASHAISAGVNIAYIAKIMGHADTKTTERHYAKYLPSYQSEDVTKLEGALKLDDSPSSDSESSFGANMRVRCKTLIANIGQNLISLFKPRRSTPKNLAERQDGRHMAA